VLSIIIIPASGYTVPNILSCSLSFQKSRSKIVNQHRWATQQGTRLILDVLSAENESNKKHSQRLKAFCGDDTVNRSSVCNSGKQGCFLRCKIAFERQNTTFTYKKYIDFFLDVSESLRDKEIVWKK
jgi:hypothetical protein